MAFLVLVRHGQSEWNLLNLFTGHTDVALSKKGKEEARRAAKLLSDISLHRAHTSDLKRAIETLKIILAETGQSHIPVKMTSAIKERHYGDLTGMNKDEAKKKFGEELFLKYRRSWDTAPPNGESLQDTANRSVPYFRKQIKKDLEEGHNVIVSAHGNSLRSIIKHIERLSPQEIVRTEIGTGVIYIYELDKDGKILRKEIRDHKNDG